MPGRGSAGKPTAASRLPARGTLRMTTHTLYESVDNESIQDYSKSEKQILAKKIYGDEIPDMVSLAIFGPSVVDARRVENCPECGWAGEVYVLCPYHQDKECPDCHGIAGTLFPCKCP